MKWSEIPDRGDTIFDGIIRSSLSFLSGHSESCNVHTIVHTVLLELLHWVDHFAIDLLSRFIWIFIKRSQDVETIFPEAIISQQCLPETPRSDNNNRSHIIGSEDSLNTRFQDRSLISDLGFPGITYHTEIFSYLDFA